jgi:hypothetical protein
LARELVILPRFKRDYRNARQHPDFDVETLEYVFDLLISAEKLPAPSASIGLASVVESGVASRSVILVLTSYSFIEYVGVQ